MSYRHNFFKLIPLFSAAGLSVLLLLLLGACQAIAQETFPPPQRLAVIPTGLWPGQIVVNPGGYAYVFVDSVDGGEIAVLDGPKLVTVIPWPEVTQNDPVKDAQMAIDPQTGELYVTEVSGYLHIIRGAQVITSISNIGYVPTGITIHPNNRLAYIATRPQHWQPGTQVKGSSSVTIISHTQIITKIDIGYIPRVIVSNPVDNRVYVGQVTGFPEAGQTLMGMVSIIEDTKVVTNTSFGPIIPAFEVLDLAVDTQNGDVYMIENLYPVLYWDRVHPPIRVKLDLSDYGNGGLNNLAVDPKHHLAYASYSGEHGGMVAAIRAGVVVAQILVGDDPHQIAVDTVRDFVYVTNYQAGTMTVIRGTEVITTLETGGFGGMHVAVDEPRGYVYVSNGNSDSITVFGFPEETVQPSLWQRFLPFIQR